MPPAEPLPDHSQLLRSIVDSSTDCIKVLDLDARLVLLGKGGMTALEVCDVELVLGQCWLDFWHGDDRLAATAAVAAARAGGTSQFIGYFETLVTKQPRWWHVVVSPIRDGSRVKQILCVSRDISERKQLEDELRRALEMRELFLSVASHELRTPLTSLQLQLGMARSRLARGTLSPDKLAQFIDVTSRQVERLDRLIDSMLVAPTLRAGTFSITPRSADLSRIVADVYERFHDDLVAAGATVTLDLCADLIGAWDVDRLEQVIENLLINVIKYAPGSTVAITTRRSATGYQLVIADRGPGIARDQQQRIFERFERAGNGHAIGGLGLGLYIAREVVEAHGGTIRVEDTVGGGATFIVELH